MTYCLAMRLDEGLVFLSDTRTNAGVDNVGTYRKLHVFRPAPDRLFVLQSAGNLATTQEVLDRIAVDLETPGEHDSLATVPHLFEAALYVGRLAREVTPAHCAALGANAAATFILGGQIGDAPPDILLVYPEGNYIRASDERPFLQIGESKYGKFMLDIAVLAHTDLVTSLKIAPGLDDEHGACEPLRRPARTMRASIATAPSTSTSAGPTAESSALGELREVWERNILNAVASCRTSGCPSRGRRTAGSPLTYARCTVTAVP